MQGTQDMVSGLPPGEWEIPEDHPQPTMSHGESQQILRKLLATTPNNLGLWDTVFKLESNLHI